MQIKLQSNLHMFVNDNSINLQSEILTLYSRFKKNKNKKKKSRKLKVWIDRQCNESAVVLISSPTRHTIGQKVKIRQKLVIKTREIDES